MKKYIAPLIAVAALFAGCGSDPRPEVCNDAKSAITLIQSHDGWESMNLGEDSVPAELIDDAVETAGNEGCAGFEGEGDDD